MDRLDAMKVFVTTVETGSFSGTARKLGMPLTTVSRKVTALESHLGTRLFIRSTRKLSLTDAGQTYLAGCSRILEEVEEVERSAAGEYTEPKGSLTVSAPLVFGRLHVLPLITEFLKCYPKIDIRLLLLDRPVQLLDEHVDLAIRIGHLPDSNLIAKRLGQIRKVICASPTYLESAGEPAEPGELSKHQCITFEGLDSPFSWTFRRGKEEFEVPVHSRITLNSTEAAIFAATEGLGITRVLSYQVDKLVKSGELILLFEAFLPPPWPVNLVYARQGALPLKLRCFIDFIAPRLERSLAFE